MGSKYITTIKTNTGDKQIDYNALAHLPNIDAIESRVDNVLNELTNNPNYAPTAEVVDIRVGYDGTTHKTAGAAVRAIGKNLEKSQEDIEDLSTELSDIHNGYDGTVYDSAGDAVRAIGYELEQVKKDVEDYVDAVAVDGLLYEENLLYLTSNGEIVSDPVEITGGSGSGGSGSSGSIVKLKNEGESAIAAAKGTPIYIQFSFISLEDDEPTGNATAKIVVNGATKATLNIEQGSHKIDVQEYVSMGENTLKLTCTDVYGVSRTITYTINVIELSISSTFDDSLLYSDDITFKFTPVGFISKTIHFIIDGDELDTMIVSMSGKQTTKVLPKMSHGAHRLEVYAVANLNGVDMNSNKLVYDIMCTEPGNRDIIVASSFNQTVAKEGDLLEIPFIVYDPSNLTADIVLTIECDGKTYFTQNRTVDRTKQIWNTRQYPYGEVTFTITCGRFYKSHVIQVAESTIPVEPTTDGLQLYLTSNNRSNSEENPGVWEYEGITTTFDKLNWVDTGWVNDSGGDTVLRLSGEARATINFMPFNADARQYGQTIELEYAIRDVNNREAVVISCMNNGIGFEATADRAFISSEQSIVDCHYRDEEKIRVSFVVEPRNDYKMLSIYLNGVLSGVTQYPDTDNFQQSSPVNISIGSSYCAVDIYNIRIYNAALTAMQIRDNYIADITNMGLKKVLYDDNNIYDSYGNLSFDALVNKIPVLVITGDLPSYKGDKKKVSVKYIDVEHPELSFEDDATIDVQGTSSQFFIRKNWKIKTNEKHMIAPDQVLTKVFTWKVDYAESTGTHNTGSANYIYELSKDIQTPPQKVDPKIRTTVYGRPCVIFHKQNDNAEPVFYGKSNGNSDKGAEETYGFTSDYPNAQSVEFLNNTSGACLFHEKIENSWGDDFEFRYPDGNDDISAFKIMHDWVVSTWQNGATGNVLSKQYTGVDGKVYTNDTAEYRLAKFKKEFTEHFEFDFCLMYYVYTFVMLMVDQRAKNMFLTTWDKVHWSGWFYDNDTILGINNEGQLVYSYFDEDQDKLGDANVFNGAESTLWTNFKESFPDEIQAFYAAWRSNNLLTYDKVIEYFITRQSDKWSASIYNEDSDFKYISMLRTDNDASNLYQVRGTGQEHLRYFIDNRLMYCDSKWYAGDYPDDIVSLRIYTPSGVQAVTPNANITVTPYSNMYTGVRYKANGTLQQQRSEANKPATFIAPSETFNDTETGIYGASEISSLGDLAPLYCGSVNVAKATKLTELIVGSPIEGYQNTNLTGVSVGANRLLQKIDVRNCPNLTDPLALGKCPNIQEVYATGSGITGVELPDSGYLKKIYLPGTVTNLTITNQQYIEEFELESYDSLTTLRVENTSGVPIEDIINHAENLNRVRLIDVYWEAESEEALKITIERFKNSLGLDAAGNNIDQAVVTGRVKVPSLSEELFSDIYVNFPELVVDDGNIKYVMKYVDYDGSVLYTEVLQDGDSAIDPVVTGKIEAPTRPATEDYRYEYVGWNILPTNVNKHYTIVAQYNIQYAVRFYNAKELLYVQWATKGDSSIDPVADGLIEAPLREGTDDLHYSFKGWDRIVSNVSAAMNIYAQFNNVYPVRFYNSDKDKTLLYVDWVLDGEDSQDPVVCGYITTPTKSGIENEIKYKYSHWDKIPKNVTEICVVNAQYDTYWAARFWNGNEIYLIEWIINGGTPVSPDKYFEDYINPVKASTPQYDFFFVRWDGSWDAMTCPIDFAAIYSNVIRKYTVYYYNEDRLLQTIEGVQYGSSATYSGSTPVKQNVDNPEEYVFKGWIPEATNIVGDTFCYALFRFTGYIKDDWDVIASHVTDGTADQIYQLGGRKAITLPYLDEENNPVIADVEIVAMNHDDLADDSGKAVLTFMCKDLPRMPKRMNPTATNEGGYEASELRVFCNGELFDNLPENLKSIIKPVYKISDGGHTNKALVTTVDKCWIPSYDEVNLPTNSYSLKGQGEPYALTFGDKYSRQKYIYNDVNYGGYWTRSSYYSLNSTGAFHRVTSAGNSYGDNAFMNSYVAFGFCI